LYGSTASTLKLQTALSGTTITDGGEIVMYDNDLIIKNREAGYIQLATSGTERMRITSAGAIHLSQGTGNAYVGTDAGNLGTSTGSYNTAFGDISLYSNTTGNFNSANGVEALQNNTIGSFNIANGF
jgi:trimeric autotransporter adhesin